MKTVREFKLQSDFSRVWSAAFGSTPPLGHVLRYNFQHIWTRFHALPNSKRYADTETECETILSRANTLVEECFDDSKNLWLVTARWEGFENDLVSRLDMTPAISWVDEQEEPEYQAQAMFFVVRIDWKHSSQDWLFTNIAEDRERAILFSDNEKTVFAPYDGGFDIICHQTEKIRHLESKFGSWMSDRPDKL
ncbi:hypothetical protein [Hoeflea sp. TYP-13]|uniref:DUF3885 domain-containing protein n=1 Tax=Hoeflea sp. TYP-13 TaxID=3230023 RepID=UPI0034C65E31